MNDLKQSDFIMYVHPFVDAYIKKGLISTYRKWRLELGGKFKILPDQSLAYLQYKVVDKNRQEIDLKEEKDMDSSATKTKTKPRIAARRNSVLAILLPTAQRRAPGNSGYTPFL